MMQLNILVVLLFVAQGANYIKEKYMIKLMPFGKSIEEIKRLEIESGQKLSKKNIKTYLLLDEYKYAKEEDITSFEKENNLLLPSEYKDFLLKNNGGIPEIHSIITSPEKGYVLNFFFGMFPHNMIIDSSIIWNMEIYSNRYPSEFMLPIASAGGGDLILLGLKGIYQSKIYYWAHEFENEEAGNKYFDNISLIFNNLRDLLNSLAA